MRARPRQRLTGEEGGAPVPRNSEPFLTGWNCPGLTQGTRILKSGENGKSDFINTPKNHGRKVISAAETKLR